MGVCEGDVVVTTTPTPGRTVTDLPRAQTLLGLIPERQDRRWNPVRHPVVWWRERQLRAMMPCLKADWARLAATVPGNSKWHPVVASCGPYRLGAQFRVWTDIGGEKYDDVSDFMLVKRLHDGWWSSSLHGGDGR